MMEISELYNLVNAGFTMLIVIVMVILLMLSFIFHTLYKIYMIVRDVKNPDMIWKSSNGDIHFSDVPNNPWKEYFPDPENLIKGIGRFTEDIHKASPWKGRGE